MYFHIRLSVTFDLNQDITSLDLEAQRVRDIVRSYEANEDFMLAGHHIRPSEVLRFRISQSAFPLKGVMEYTAEPHDAETFSDNNPREWHAAEVCPDVTESWITRPPVGPPTTGRHATPNTIERSMNQVFVVHGHDEALRDNVEAFLRRHGIKPVILHRQTDQGRTIIEKVEYHSSVQYAMVLLTPDDLGNAKILASQDAPHLNPRARQNVILEWGYFLGQLGRSRVMCIRKGDVEIPSDYDGVLRKDIAERIEEKELDVLRELLSAGLELVDQS